ncbi:MAG: DUF4358 domain-containing protein [Clostridiales bacterium]|nr:DUF4358 domain-containing protein [Clostridiales bacterium]
MKKLVSCALVLTMVLSLAGCSKSSGFGSIKKKTVSALEKTCDAEEASEKTKKKLIKNNMETADNLLSDGKYVVLTAEDLEDIDVDDDVEDEFDFNMEDCKNILFYIKEEGNEQMHVAVVEMNDKETAQDYFDTLEDGLRIKQMKKELKNAKADYGIVSEDDLVAVMYQMASERGGRRQTSGCYLNIKGNVVTMTQYVGSGKDDDILDEYYAFMNEAGFYDMEALMEDSEED